MAMLERLRWRLLRDHKEAGRNAGKDTLSCAAQVVRLLLKRGSAEQLEDAEGIQRDIVNQLAEHLKHSRQQRSSLREEYLHRRDSLTECADMLR